MNLTLVDAQVDTLEDLAILGAHVQVDDFEISHGSFALSGDEDGKAFRRGWGEGGRGREAGMEGSGAEAGMEEVGSGVEVTLDALLVAAISACASFPTKRSARVVSRSVRTIEKRTRAHSSLVGQTWSGSDSREHTTRPSEA